MEDKVIKRNKRLHRNIFPLFRKFSGRFFLEIIIVVLSSSVIDVLIEYFFKDIVNQVIFRLLAILIIGILWFIEKEKNIVIAYKITKQFSGLYCVDNLKNLNLNIENGLLPREKEAQFLLLMVEKVFSDEKEKCLICISGKSGCGKSTILYFLKQESENNEFQILDYSKKYDFLLQYLVLDWGENWEDKIKNNKLKTIIIFDQFEQVFYKSEETRKDIAKVIKTLVTINIAVIISIREEYLASLFQMISLNNYGNIERHGIIEDRKISSVCKDGIYFLTCLDEMEFQDRDTVVRESLIQLQCNAAFGTDASTIYEKVKNDRLIQQQIILNMLCNEKNNDRFIELKKQDSNYYLKRYYDVQLCSTGDFFIASRLMYLLMRGALNHIFFEKQDFMRALCIPDIRCEKENFNRVILKLQEVQLVKRNVYNSEEVYEIAHDYVAKSYEAYANTEMSADIKAALDEYVTEYLKETKISERIDSYREHRAISCRYANVILFLSVVICIGYNIYKYIQGNEETRMIVVLLSVVSLGYVYAFFYNITRFCMGRKIRIVQFSFMISMLSGTLASVSNGDWLFWLGMGNTFIGVSTLAIGYDKKISNLGKKMYLSYGGKTVLVGILLCYMDIYMKRFGNGNEVLLIEVVAMGALLVYAYYSHMNEEFIYTHLEGMFSSNSGSTN